MGAHRITTILAAAALLPALAQRDITGPSIGLGSIHGRVMLQDAPNQPLEHVPVQLHQGNGVPMGTVYTSGNGQFVFNNLGTGSYEVTAELPGYRRASERVVIQTASGRIQLRIHLYPAEAAAKRSTGPAAVSVDEMRAPPAARREFEKGSERLKKDDLRAAERHFRKAVELHPAYPSAWVELGRILARTSRPGDALQSFQAALVHDEKNREALVSMARLLNDQGRYLDALRAAAQLEQVYAGDARNHLEIARGLLGAGKIAEAEAAARRLEREPHGDAPEVHLVLFSISQSRGEKASAATELRTYLKELEDSGVAPTTAAVVRARELLDKLEREIAAAK